MRLNIWTTGSLGLAILLLGSSVVYADPPQNILEDPGRNRRPRASFLLREEAPKIALRNIPTGGNANVSGVESVSYAYLKTAGLGRAKVTISASWDYVGYSSAHPCALLNVLPHDFSGNVFVNGNYDPANIWTADATVVIKRQRNSSETIIGAIRGRRVYELYAGTATDAPMLPCSVNESLISFTITGGTGRYANYGGSGSLRAVVNTCAVGGLPYDLVSASLVPGVDPADAVVLDQISLRIER